MKWSALLPLTVGAFLTATAFRLTLSAPQKPPVEKTFIAKKQPAVRCAPDYRPSANESIPLLTGWGHYQWKITTRSDSAQAYFNQGMAMYFAFHIVEARASFDKATRFDPTCAMAWWGKALAFGPNINDFGYQPPSEAYPAAQKARSLSASATPLEKALIAATTVRYNADTAQSQNSLNKDYATAMAGVYKQFSKNADVAALYADALLLLHPWDLYQHDFTPKAWTPKIVTVIKEALRLSPNHPGANHYFIHAVEASARPGEALRSAEVLARAMPNVSHITHMPSHIYIRTGYYNKGITLNDQAVAGYQHYLTTFAPVVEGAFLYSLHNLHMKVACAQMAGAYGEALSAAKALQEAIPADYLSISGPLEHYLQYLHQSPLLTYIRFGKWNEILNAPLLDTLEYAAVLQHFGRGLALAKTAKVAEAAIKLSLMKTGMQKASLKEPFTPFNAAYDEATVAKNILEGVLAEAGNNTDEAIRYFAGAVKAEDKLIYNEPRDWLLPARHYLGNALLTAGRYKEAVDVLKQDLIINPANGWAITGMQTALQHLARPADLYLAKQRLKSAWLMKDVEIWRPVF